MLLPVLAALALHPCFAVGQSETEIESEPESTVVPFEKKSTTAKIPYVNVPTNSHWENLEFDHSIYDTPYKVSLFKPKNGEDGQRLWSQTKSIFAFTVGAGVVKALMPDDEEDRNIWKQWSDNVSQGAVWEHNAWYINYIGHPYFGGTYYQVARKSGYRQWDSFVYSFLMSTFYWEYGVEAFAEPPSVQDLVVTPVVGWLYGEWAFSKQQEIRLDGGTLGGSKILGSTALFFLDPVDAFGTLVNNTFNRQLVTAGTGYMFYGDVPLGDLPDAPKEKQLKLNFQYTIGQGDEPVNSRRYHDLSDDPVDTGIIGFSMGTGYFSLDDKWNFEDAAFPEFSLGLYFSPRFSLRLKYGRARLKDRLTGEKTTYENYSLGTQFYFNSESKTRPYITAGFGEQMFDEDTERKNVIWNVGFGVHHKISSKWALQADWENFYSPSEKTYENSVNARVVYRFGRGEER